MSGIRGRPIQYKEVDIGALVFDIGHHSLRVGYGRESFPTYDIPAVVGVLEDVNGNSATVPEEIDLILEIDSNITSNTKYHVDTVALNFPRKGMEVVSYMKDGVVEDWDLFEKVLDYTYSKCIQSESELHPVLMSEAPWNPTIKREKLTEIMFEKYNVPAFFLVKNAVLALFANGKRSGLVVDSGAAHTSAVPVKDGIVLPEGIVRSPLGGDYISKQCKQYLQESNIEVVPPYMIKSKERVNEKEKAIWTKKENIPEVTASWHDYMVGKVIQDFQNCILEVSEVPYNKNNLSSKPAVQYEFPNGYHQKFGTERFQIPEVMFNPGAIPVQGGALSNTELGVSEMVKTSIEMCNPKHHRFLYRHIFVTGGNSVIKGFPERLNRDLLTMQHHSNEMITVKIENGSTERKFGSWIGGSILTTWDSFHQLWISRQEYEELGKGQIDSKCP